MALYPETGYQSGLKTPLGVRIRGSIKPGYETVLTHEALAFVADLVRTFRPIVQSNLALRALDQAKYDAGGHPGFDFRTKAIREEDWTCGPMPAVIQNRRVEITGPVDRKMVINALNSGAKVFMADFEDSLAPTWSNLVEGHINLRDAISGNIRYEDPRSKKVYAVTSPNPAILFVRPRGWHLPEAHIEVDGQPIPGCLMDFGLYFFHNQAAFRAKHGGAGPFFYLPKMQHSREAAVWNAVFERAQDALGVPRGSIKATVLIETLPAVFQMHEILYELRQHSAGLNCGRWDYIFSFIKTFRNHSELVIPDRTQVGMTQHFLSSYAQLLIQTCHRRGVHAMGGMAAQIPVKNDPKANEAASAKVRADKLREVLAGHDGTWAAHPGLIPLVYEVFDAHMPTPNQLHRLRDDVMVSEADLLAMPVGTRTLEGLRLNLSVGVQYTAAWLTGTGSVPLHNLMEDAATAEISRVQVWQWLRHGAILDGEQAPVRVTRDLVDRILHEEVALLERQLGPQRFAAGRYQEAAQLFGQQCTAKELDDFLTLEAYKRLAEVRPNSRL